MTHSLLCLFSRDHYHEHVRLSINWSKLRWKILFEESESILIQINFYSSKDRTRSKWLNQCLNTIEINWDVFLSHLTWFVSEACWARCNGSSTIIILTRLDVDQIEWSKKRISSVMWCDVRFSLSFYFTSIQSNRLALLQSISFSFSSSSPSSSSSLGHIYIDTEGGRERARDTHKHVVSLLTSPSSVSLCGHLCMSSVEKSDIELSSKKKKKKNSTTNELCRLVTFNDGITCR